MEIINAKKVIELVSETKCAKHGTTAKIEFEKLPNNQVRFYTDDLCCKAFQKLIDKRLIDCISSNAADNIIDEILNDFD